MGYKPATISPVILPRLSPDGFVAQLFKDESGVTQWVLLHWRSDSGLMLTRLTDDEVAGWPELVRANG